MDLVLQLVHQHAHAAPFLVFGLLMLAGLNVPISEDALILASALLATEHHDLLVSLFVALYSGAYLSDLVCYWLGRRFGPRLWRLPGFSRVVPFRHVHGLGHFYTRYGVGVLLVGRFIPFGVRNGLLLTAGLGRMPFLRLAVTDLVAATVSCSFYFWLYYTYGRSVVRAVADSQIALFFAAAVVILVLLVRRYLLKRLDQAG
jgi:membrane protein DedA with SNARE-associated domain